MLLLVLAGNAGRVWAGLRGDRSPASVALLALTVIGGWYLASTYALFFRWKEALPVQPVLAVLVAAAAVHAFERLSCRLSQRRAAGDSRSPS